MGHYKEFNRFDPWEFFLLSSQTVRRRLKIRVVFAVL